MTGPVCMNKELDDCFARNRDFKGIVYCTALHNTDFNKQCPFYKPKLQVIKERKAHGGPMSDAESKRSTRLEGRRNGS